MPCLPSVSSPPASSRVPGPTQLSLKRCVSRCQCEDERPGQDAYAPRHVHRPAIILNLLASSQRIIGLYAYLTSVLADPLFASKTEVTAFLGKGEDTSKPWDDEDAIPSTMGVARAADVKNALVRPEPRLE